MYTHTDLPNIRFRDLTITYENMLLFFHCMPTLHMYIYIHFVVFALTYI